MPDQSWRKVRDTNASLVKTSSDDFFTVKGQPILFFSRAQYEAWLNTFCITFSSESAFTLNTDNTAKNWGGTLYYSTDSENWLVWDGTTTLAAVIHSDDRYYLCLRGTGNKTITGYAYTKRWVLTGSDISCSGNIETLLDYQTVANGNHPPMNDYCYSNLFHSCTSLITPPSLPAVTLSGNCYNGMFYNCTNLTVAPELPADTLAEYCYQNMFNGCTALTRTPVLSFTTLARYCCYAMFSRCTSLVAVSQLPATALAENCYQQMFYSCTSLESLPELSATTLADKCYREMFSNCSLIKLSTTQTGDYQTPYRIPSSGTGTEGTESLALMFLRTGGTFSDTPSINTTYYTSNTVIH